MLDHAAQGDEEWPEFPGLRQVLLAQFPDAHLQLDLGRQGRLGLRLPFFLRFLSPSRASGAQQEQQRERGGGREQVPGIAADGEQFLQRLDVLVVLAQQGADADGQLPGLLAGAAPALREQFDPERADGEVAGPEKGDDDGFFEGAALGGPDGGAPAAADDVVGAGRDVDADVRDAGLGADDDAQFDALADGRRSTWRPTGSPGRLRPAAAGPGKGERRRGSSSGDLFLALQEKVEEGLFVILVGTDGQGVDAVFAEKLFQPPAFLAADAQKITADFRAAEVGAEIFPAFQVLEEKVAAPRRRKLAAIGDIDGDQVVLAAGDLQRRFKAVVQEVGDQENDGLLFDQAVQVGQGVEDRGSPAPAAGTR